MLSSLPCVARAHGNAFSSAYFRIGRTDHRPIAFSPGSTAATRLMSVMSRSASSYFLMLGGARIS